MTFAFRGTETAGAWRDWRGSNFDVSDGGVTIAEAPEPAYVSPERLPGEFEPVDLALEECGDLYLLAASGEIRRYDRVRGSLERLPCTWRTADAGAATGIAVTRRSIYVAGAGGTVQAYARRLLQTRWVLTAPFESPVALAVSKGALLVLDEGDGTPGAGFLARVGADGAVDRPVEGLTSPTDVATDGRGGTYVLAGPAGSRSVTAFDAAFEPSSPVALPADLAGTGIEAEPDGGVLLGVDASGAGGEGVVRVQPGSFPRLDALSAPVSALALSAGGARGRPDGLFVVAGDPGRVQFLEATTKRRVNDVTDRHDAQVVRRIDSGEAGTRWHRVTADVSLPGPGTQVGLRYLATDDGDLEYEEEPVSLETVDGIGSTYADRLRARGVIGLSELVEQSPEAVAQAVSTEVLDVSPSRVAEWIEGGRRLLDERGAPLELESIDGIGSTFAGRLRDAGIGGVSALVDRAPAAVARIVSAGVYEVPPSRAEAWIAEARALLAERDDVRGADWTTMERPNPRDALLSDAEGRYLWVRLDLVGGPFATPRVDAFRAYFPRDSYLRHLPAVYREDEESAAFLERFLSIFESTFEDVGEEIDAATRLLDPAGIPASSLSWLGDWLAIEAGETWPEPARRELVARAPELFKKRGTREGLLDVLRVYLRHAAGDAGETGDDASHAGEDAEESRSTDEDSLVYLLEHSDLDCIDDADVRELYERLVPCPQCFLVMVRSSLDDEAVRTVERVVDREQPAHAVGRAIQLRPWIQLGGNSYLGIDTRLPERRFVLEEAGLGKDSVLREREPDGQLGISSRIGTDTTIS